MVGSEYYNDPVRFWNGTSLGKGRERGMGKSQKRTIGLMEADERLRLEVMARHPFRWGMDYFNCRLMSGWKSTVVTRSVGFGSYMMIPGLSEDGTINSWQEDMMEAEGYYLFETGSGIKTNVLDGVKKYIGNQIRVYLLDDRFRNRSDKFWCLYDDGREYYAITTFNPNCQRDVLALMHELGHAFLLENDPSQRERIMDESGSLPEYNQFEREILFLEELDLPAEEEYGRVEALFKWFRRTGGYRRMVGAYMKLELETWIATWQLIDQIGLNGLFPDRKNLHNYICWCIRTRLDGVK